MDIQEIKSALRLSQVLRHYGLTPDRNSRLRCPFHADKTPSLQVYLKTDSCYCFSTNCKTHGKSIDVIDFIMYKEGCTKHEAILKAKELLGEVPSPKVESTTSVANRVEVLTKLFLYFKKSVGYSQTAKDYLQKRCLDHEKVEVGYNSGQFHHGKRKEKELIASCLQYGLLLERSAKSRTGELSYQPFGKWCLVFALRNERHEIVGLYFRSTFEKKDQRHFYLKDRQGLYPHYPPKQAKRLILTESIIDAASLLQQQHIRAKYSVLALYGVNGFTKEHLRAIKEVSALEEVIFFLNGDAAGQEAVRKYASLLRSELASQVQITQVVVPEQEDVNSLLQACLPNGQGHSEEIFVELLANRKSCEHITPKADKFLSNETTTEVDHPSDEKKRVTLDTSNPYNLKYSSQAADYCIKGFVLEKQRSQLDSLKVSLQIIDRKRSIDHRAKLDLYEYGHIKRVALAAAERLQMRNDWIEKDLSALTHLLEEYRDTVEKVNPTSHKEIKVTASAQQSCIDFMQKPNLLQRINELIGEVGIVGESNNRLLLFIVASSYKMPDTLHALIQGSSGSGKTNLMRTIAEVMPTESVKRYTRVTDNSFYNQDEHFFVHKLVCFEDLDGLKEDAQLAVRELQSNEILITSTSIKDANGSIRGGERIVRGPIASLSCTTKGELYEDNISRCFIVAVDESKEQSLRVIAYQNQLAAGMIDRSKQQRSVQFLQNCMRMLQPYEVVNPFADKIHLPEHAHKIRRLNELYQSFVRQITLLHQFQRNRDQQGRLISQKEDLKLACDILFESIVLKVDELDGSLRQFFEALKNYIKEQSREFTQREVRQALHISKSQMQRYMYALQHLGYVHQSGGYINKGLRYKIDYWDNHHKTRLEIRDFLEKQLATL